MYQLGNLAIICAQRDDIELQIGQKKALVFAGGSMPIELAWDDDKGILAIIRELNFGKLKEKGETQS